jgi:hypothetical protein
VYPVFAFFPVNQKLRGLAVALESDAEGSPRLARDQNVVGEPCSRPALDLRPTDLTLQGLRVGQVITGHERVLPVCLLAQARLAPQHGHTNENCFVEKVHLVG